MVGLDGPPAGGDPYLLEGLSLDSLADGHNHIVAGNAEFLGVRVPWPGTSIPAVSANELRTGPQSGHLTLRVRLNAGGGLEGQDLTALRHSLLNLLSQGRHVLHPAAVDAGDAFRSQPQSGAGGVHGHVAAADHANPLSSKIGGLSIPYVPQ